MVLTRRFRTMVLESDVEYADGRNGREKNDYSADDLPRQHPVFFLAHNVVIYFLRCNVLHLVQFKGALTGPRVRRKLVCARTVAPLV